MSQPASFLSLGSLTKLTHADRFLDEMNRVVRWTELGTVVAPHYAPATTGCKPTDLLRLRCLQLSYNLSDPGLEDAVRDRGSFQRFLGCQRPPAIDPLSPVEK